jgi:thiamine biosynthesis protein ThiC
MAKLFRQRKGQSAIEYLTTYGWMLLVIAIVGGAIFTTVQGSTNLQSSSGLANADIQIDNFGITTEGGNEDLQLELRNAAQEQVESVNVTVGSHSEVQVGTIPVGETATATMDNFTQDQTQDDFEVVIDYHSGGLNNLQVNGTITGNIGYTG